MARSFSGSSQYLGYAGAPVAAAPLTMACWFLPTSAFASGETILSVSQGVTGGSYFSLFVTGTAGKIGARTSPGGFATSAIASTLGAWNHGAAVFTSSTSRTVYIDGGNSGTNATSGTPTGINQTAIGQLWLATHSAFFTGSIAEVGFWNAALTANEVAALASGRLPYEIRPQALIGYWPLWGLFSPEPDLSGNAQNMTVTGATLANGPPVVPFTRSKSYYFAPGGSSLAASGSCAGVGIATGTATLALAASATVAGVGTASGNAHLALAASGTGTGKGIAAGTASVALAASGACVGIGKATGTATIAGSSLAASGTCRGVGIASGAPSLRLAASGSAAGKGAASGMASLALAALGACEGIGKATGAATVTGGSLAASGACVGVGRVSGAPSLLLSPSGSCIGKGIAAGRPSLLTWEIPDWIFVAPPSPLLFVEPARPLVFVEPARPLLFEAG